MRCATQVQGTADLLHEHAVKVFETHELALQLVDERSSSLDWPTIEKSEDARITT